MRVTIHQPNFIPRLKVLQKIVRGDLWVILDDVQFVTREWQNRTRPRYLRESNREFWLTIPVNRPTGRCSPIRSVLICNYKHVENKVRNAIWYTYHRSKHWNWIGAYTEEIFTVPTSFLSDLCVKSTLACLSKIGISKPVLYASELKIIENRTTKLVKICEALEAKIYVSGSGGRNYLNEDEFKAAGIEVEWQVWSAPNVPVELRVLDWRNIAFLDLVARCGPDALREHLLYWRGERCHLNF